MRLPFWQRFDESVQMFQPIYTSTVKIKNLQESFVRVFFESGSAQTEIARGLPERENPAVRNGNSVQYSQL